MIFHDMTYGEGFVKCAKCLLVALWHTGTMLDGSVRSLTHCTACHYHTCAFLARLPGQKHRSPTTTYQASGITSTDPEHEGFVDKS